MYYRIKRATGLDKIGDVDEQFQDAVYPVPVDHPDFLGKVFLKEINVEKIIPAYPKLKSKAKRTDLIGGTWYGNVGWLLMSGKLKSIIEKEKHKGLQFVKTHITHKGKQFDDYWFTNTFNFDMDKVDFLKSELILYDFSDYSKKVPISFSDNILFENYVRQLKFPQAVIIDKIVFNTMNNLVIIDRVSGAIGYYVSERLKDEIEYAGCTGIDFEPIEQA